MSEIYLSTTEEYLVNGNNFDKERLSSLEEGDVDFAEQLAKHGLRLEYWYLPVSEDVASPIFDPEKHTGLPVVSFSYFKNGELEPDRRLIVWDGEGYGVMQGHANQEPAHYIAGCQIGTIQDEKIMYNDITDGGRRNFSMDCIMGGDRAYNPVDAVNGMPYEDDIQWIEGIDPIDLLNGDNETSQTRDVSLNPEMNERERAELAKREQIKAALEISAPELLIGKLPSKLEERLGGAPYVIGFNQSGCNDLESAIEYLNTHGGVDFSGYSLKHRFLMINDRYPDFAESYAVSGYYGAMSGGKFVMAAPFIRNVDEFQAMSPELSPDFALLSGSLPSDFEVRADAIHRQVNVKYIAGFIDSEGVFYANQNFAVDDVLAID